MEITADEISEGDMLVDCGLVGRVYTDTDDDGPFVVAVVGHDEFTFYPGESVQVR